MSLTLAIGVVIASLIVSCAILITKMTGVFRIMLLGMYLVSVIGGIGLVSKIVSDNEPNSKFTTLLDSLYKTSIWSMSVVLLGFIIFLLTKAMSAWSQKEEPDRGELRT
jgi:ABC-type Fe3+-siderophore transport system permease subunit|tara:strand:- start:22789 stop:23115 length:327 start_codon:yes stop_codon:yes gene_type:complete